MSYRVKWRRGEREGFVTDGDSNRPVEFETFEEAAAFAERLNDAIGRLGRSYEAESYITERKESGR